VPTQVKHFEVLRLIANSRSRWKSLTGTNVVAYLPSASVTKKTFCKVDTRCSAPAGAQS
jgi:hypothetical protein